MAPAAARAAASDRVRVGFIGVGLIGTRHLIDFAAQPDVDVVAVAELSPARAAAARALTQVRPQEVTDFRRILDRNDVDAVVVSTPDHWHALMTIMACAAGKDVYVEKPLTHVVREGDWMMTAATRHRRVVQVGTQQRSGSHYQRARSLVRAGHIGDLRQVHIRATRNIVPGFTRPVDDPELSPEAWDMWLGPAPFVPFDPRRALYHFRWFWDYSGGQTTNLLAHDLDIVQWMTGAMPTRVAAFAQRRSLEGFGETPDAFEAIYEFPEFLLTWTSSEATVGGGAGSSCAARRAPWRSGARASRSRPTRSSRPTTRFLAPASPADQRPIVPPARRRSPMRATSRCATSSCRTCGISWLPCVRASNRRPTWPAPSRRRRPVTSPTLPCVSGASCAGTPTPMT